MLIHARVFTKHKHYTISSSKIWNIRRKWTLLETSHFKKAFYPLRKSNVKRNLNYRITLKTFESQFEGKNQRYIQLLKYQNQGFDVQIEIVFQ